MTRYRLALPADPLGLAALARWHRRRAIDRELRGVLDREDRRREWARVWSSQPGRRP